MENFTQEMFAAHLNTVFYVPLADSQRLALELIAVDGYPPSPGQVRFALVFKGPLETPLGQGLVRMEHAQMEPLDICLVPIAHEADGFLYEAVFNLLVDT